jgi:hypothetical protein
MLATDVSVRQTGRSAAVHSKSYASCRVRSGADVYRSTRRLWAAARYDRNEMESSMVMNSLQPFPPDTKHVDREEA